MNRKPFENVKKLLQGGKLASDSQITKEDLFELGMVEKEVEKIAAAGNYMGQQAWEVIKEGMMAANSGQAPTAQQHQGETPLQKEQPTQGGAVHTDHAKKDEVPSQEAMKKVKSLLQVPKIEQPSGEGSGAVSENVGVNDEEVSTKGTGGEIGKTSSDNEYLDTLLELS